jgi:hypothetical protein
MAALGHLTTRKSWTRLLQDLQETMRKWGKKDWLPPTFQQSLDTRHVKVQYAVQGKWVVLDSHKFRTPEQNLAAICEALDAVRKAEQRGLGELLAVASQVYALPEGDPSTLLAAIGAAPGATKEQQLTAFREALKRTHPDHGGNSFEFRKVMAAGEALGLREAGEKA